MFICFSYVVSPFFAFQKYVYLMFHRGSYRCTVNKRWFKNGILGLNSPALMSSHFYLGPHLLKNVSRIMKIVQKVGWYHWKKMGLCIENKMYDLIFITILPIVQRDFFTRAFLIYFTDKHQFLSVIHSFSNCIFNVCTCHFYCNKKHVAKIIAQFAFRG